MTLAELAAHVGGRLLRADPVRTVTGIASIETADSDEVAVVFDALPASLGSAGLLVVGPNAGTLPDRPVVVVDEPRVALAQLSALFAKSMVSGAGVHPSAAVSQDSQVDSSAYVGPHSVIESGAVIGRGARLVAQVYVGRGAVVGADCLILPGVTLYPGTRLGARVTVQAGARIGCDGFGYVTESPDLPKVHSLGGVLVEDEVEIGANTTIERGTLTDTVLGRGSRIGDGCGIGHNCLIGDHCILVGHVAIAGSVCIGSRARLGAGVLVRDHVTIGDGAVILMGSEVVQDVPAGARMLGAPAVAEDIHKERVRGWDLSRRLVNEVTPE